MFRESPLAIATTLVAALSLWTCAYRSPSRGDEAAAATSGATVGSEEAGSTHAGGGGSSQPGVRGIAPRTGPRVLRQTDPEQPFGVDIALEDRDGKSMAALHAALRRAERGEGQARVVFYGASHVASDFFTGVVRRELQQRFGDAGPGFVLPVKPWRYYHHKLLSIDSDWKNWTSKRVRVQDVEEDHYGLAGVWVETDKAKSYGSLTTPTRGRTGRTVSRYELFYWKQPGGGDVDVFIDGRRQERVRTEDSQPGPAYATFEVADTPHRIELRVRGNGPVRLFGVASERAGSGVVVDTLGVNGSRARYQLLWNDALFREHLARRKPDLVVLAYGTNESGDDLPMERYEERLRRVVARLKDAAPQASCLLVGPSDMPMQMEEGTYADRPRTHAIIATQYRVALEYGCAFFDLVAFQGGPLSMLTWSASDPAWAQGDLIHFTRRGYERLGEVLLQALMENYEPAAHGRAARSALR